MREK
jgi:hypothetical protein